MNKYEKEYIDEKAKKFKEEMRKEIHMNENKIATWKAVKRQRKKDGGDFANLSKNFEHAWISTNINGQPVIMVRCSYNMFEGKSYGGYTDELNIFEYDDKKTSGRKLIQTSSWSRPYYIYTVDEIFKKIARHIKHLEEQNEEYKKQIEVADAVFHRFSSKVHEAFDELNKMTGDRSSLYYACREYVKTIY